MFTVLFTKLEIGNFEMKILSTFNTQLSDFLLGTRKPPVPMSLPMASVLQRLLLRKLAPSASMATTQRGLGTTPPPPRRDIPVLSEMARRVAPNLVHYLRSQFFIHAIISPYFDPDFSKEEFKQGAARAVEVVSDALSRGDFDALETVMEKSCLDDVKRKLSFTTSEERQSLAVRADEIYQDFIYEVGIMFDEAVKDRYVEITYVAHSHPDARHYSSSLTRTAEELIRSGPVILNYRFLRRYTKGSDPSDWTVSAINHFSIKSLSH